MDIPPLGVSVKFWYTPLRNLVRNGYPPPRAGYPFLTRLGPGAIHNSGPEGQTETPSHTCANVVFAVVLAFFDLT